MTDFNNAKKKLTALQAEYQSRIDKIAYDLQHPESDMLEDWDDQSLVNEQNDIDKSLLVEAQKNLELVNNALLRIENGTYGICAVSGEEIEPERLEAVPYATTCMKHAV